MHIDTAALAAAITRACAELERLDAAAAEGEIGRLGARRLLLRIEPAGEDWAGSEIPLPPGAADIVREGGSDTERDADAAQIAAVLAELEGDPASAERLRADAGDIRSPFNRCCYRDACRELLLALALIVENPDHDLLATERETAEAAIRRATGEDQQS